jgi:hypothetical protein
MERFLYQKSVIRPEQYGSQHVTAFLLTKWVLHKIHGFNHKKAPVALYPGIERVFNTVWHSGSIKNCMTLVPLPLTEFIKSQLENRSDSTAASNTACTITQIRAEVPQGSLRGPTLFNIYISDIPFDYRLNINFQIHVDGTCT